MTDVGYRKTASANKTKQHHDDELLPTQTEGYKVGEAKTMAELAALDQEDESLQRWKASLGLTGAAGGSGKKEVVPVALFLTAPSRPGGDIVLDLTMPAADIAKLKKDPISIKEGAEYSVGIKFQVKSEIVSGLKYLQVVKRAGVTMDKTEAMLGSYGPQEEPYTKVFASEEAPTGFVARSGGYAVRSRLIDDDNNVWIDVEWGFKLCKDW